jgi:hypothetical protein
MEMSYKQLIDRGFTEIELDYCNIYTKNLSEEITLEVYSNESVWLTQGEVTIYLGTFNTIERLDSLIEVLTIQD